MPMKFVLNAENAKRLDRLIRTTKSNSITIDSSASAMMVLLLSPDSSHYTTLRLEPEFFEQMEPGPKAVSLLRVHFYEPNMRRVTVMATSECATLRFEFSDAASVRAFPNEPLEVFDIEFVPERLIRFNFQKIRKALRHFKGKIAKFEFGRQLLITGDEMSIRVDEPIEGAQISVVLDTVKLRAILSVVDMFEDSFVGFTDNESPLNLVFRGPDIFMNTFISIEDDY